MPSAKCEECHVGRCQSVGMTYMHRLGSHMVVMPNAPANRCDMCGRVLFDPGFLQAMQVMMENFARDSQTSSRKKVPLADPLQEWTPVRQG